MFYNILWNVLECNVDCSRNFFKDLIRVINIFNKNVINIFFCLKSRDDFFYTRPPYDFFLPHLTIKFLKRMKIIFSYSVRKFQLGIFSSAEKSLNGERPSERALYYLPTLPTFLCSHFWFPPLL